MGSRVAPGRVEALEVPGLGPEARLPGQIAIYPGNGVTDDKGRVFLTFAGSAAVFAFDLRDGEGRSIVR
ncbi:MAG: hypothetical protein D6729_06100 [Deltaproteobacteria bacterium]|nr:MAG: hypothetical protein D6729_06100 [Deltaproteobacteria bacterium]